MFAALFLSLALNGQDSCGRVPSPECTAGYVAAATTKLGLSDLDADVASGAFIYRAIFNEGDRLPAVSFERRPDEGPKLVLYGEAGRRPERPISASLWEEVVRRSAYAGQDLPDDGVEMDCNINWMTTLQIGRPATKSEREKRSEVGSRLAWGPHRPWTLTKSQETCDGGLTSSYALLLAEMACAELPECEVMGEARGLNGPQNLAASLRLHGDKIAAAGLYKARWLAPPITYVGRGRDTRTAAQWEAWLASAYQARLDWNGQVLVAETEALGDQPASAIATFLAEKGKALDSFSIQPEEFGAIDAENGWIEGFVRWRIDEDGVRQTFRAPYRQEWVLKWGRTWGLSSWTVGAPETLN